MKKLLGIVILSLLLSGNAYSKENNELYLKCIDNITTVNKGNFEKGINGYKYFYFKFKKKVDFTKDPNPFLGIETWKLRDQKEIGKKRRKIRWFDKITYWHNPDNKMIINKFKFTQETIESDYVTMKHIVINKTSEPKKWEYTYDYLFKDIDGESSFIVVDYCYEMTKKELNKFAKKKIF
jgi:hypothetical protein